MLSERTRIDKSITTVLQRHNSPGMVTFSESLLVFRFPSFLSREFRPGLGSLLVIFLYASGVS